MNNDFYCPYNLTRNDCRCCEDVIIDLCSFGDSSVAFFARVAFMKAKYRRIREAKYGK